MSLNPVTSYKQPHYPKRELFLDNPSLFDEFVPKRWKSTNISLGALATALLGGCINTTEPDVPVKDNSRYTISENPLDYDAPQKVADGSQEDFHVAPLFLHGGGKGSTGCMMIAPPVFLSEAEAYNVIVETLGNYDVTIDTQKITLPDVMLARTGMVIDSSTKTCSQDTVKNIPLELGGYDASKKIGVRFISIQDHYDMRRDNGCECGNNGIITCSSVSSYDLIDIAEEVADGLQRQGSVHGGVFYDPCNDIDEYARYHSASGTEKQAMHEEVRQKSLGLLKQQVKDFANYLKNKGVITPLSIKP